ncbi:MAG: hypothetical protein AVDCRST_MAG49-2874, partial [uncultured Thermomicrobiales bacterium]
WTRRSAAGSGKRSPGGSAAASCPRSCSPPTTGGVVSTSRPATATGTSTAWSRPSAQSAGPSTPSTSDRPATPAGRPRGRPHP